ncbi:MAG: hypothetical protein HY906_19605 [Deltaproteobacteria bacterium]|nr:hypothetical protein [Deltaproteobacteria bacterium]
MTDREHGVPPDPLAPRPAGGERDALEAAPDEPPVAARLVVEIRTDGTRTVARGAVEDAILGERIAVKVEGQTPLELALALARAFVEVPFLQRVFTKGPSLLGSAARALVPGGKKRGAP